MIFEGITLKFQFLFLIHRLHTGGYSVVKKDEDRFNFQIVHHLIDLNELTLKKIPVRIETNVVFI